MSKNCHHPQGGFCDNCRAPGLNPTEADRVAALTLVSNNYQRIIELAAYFVEGSDELRSLMSAMEKTILRSVEADMRRRRHEKAGELDYVPE